MFWIYYNIIQRVHLFKYPINTTIKSTIKSKKNIKNICDCLVLRIETKDEFSTGFQENNIFH